jgi:hypothetical protein
MVKGDLIHAYLGYNTVHIGHCNLRKESKEREELQLILHIAIIKKLYAQAIMMSTISVKKFLTVLTDKYYSLVYMDIFYLQVFKREETFTIVIH